MRTIGNIYIRSIISLIIGYILASYVSDLPVTGLSSHQIYNPIGRMFGVVSSPASPAFYCLIPAIFIGAVCAFCLNSKKPLIGILYGAAGILPLIFTSYLVPPYNPMNIIVRNLDIFFIPGMFLGAITGALIISILNIEVVNKSAVVYREEVPFKQEMAESFDSIRNLILPVIGFVIVSVLGFVVYDSIPRITVFMSTGTYGVLITSIVYGIICGLICALIIRVKTAFAGVIYGAASVSLYTGEWYSSTIGSYRYYFQGTNSGILEYIFSYHETYIFISLILGGVIGGIIASMICWSCAPKKKYIPGSLTVTNF